MRGVLLLTTVRLTRVVSLALLAALGCTLLMRCAPGYFTDSREMDAQFAQNARTDLQTLQLQQGSAIHLLGSQLRSWAHGDFGTSRHYGTPVAVLLHERTATSVRLLAQGIGLGWLLAVALALPLSTRSSRRGDALIVGSTALLLALPVGVLATLCLLLDKGSPALVLALLVAVRDFKLLHRMLREFSGVPHLLFARAQGLAFAQILRLHILPVLGRELLALAMISLTLALSALVPLEVLFNVPGIGQLAWSAAINRDLPVLVAVTALVALCVGFASLFATPEQASEAAQCA